MAHAARSPPCKKEALTGDEFLPYATLASSITPPHVSRRRICFAAIPGCWPGRALPTSGCPQPGRPRSGCALGPFVPHVAHAPMEVSRTASRRLRAVFAYAPTAARWRGLPPASCSARPTPPSGLMQGLRGRVVSVRHARPAAHTLRAVVRSAALSGLSAYVQSISQRGRQRLTAAATQQSPHATGIRLPAAPPAADAQQRPPEAVPEPRQPLLRPPNSPAPQRASAGSWQPTRCHMPPRTPPHL